MFQSRATSWPEDETTTIAELLEVDIAKLFAEEEADARMRAFCLQLKTLLTGIIFNRAPKLPFLGICLALPRSLSAGGSARRIPWTTSCTARSLTMEWPFLVIALGSTPASQ